MSDSSTQPLGRGQHKYAILFFLVVVQGIINPALPKASFEKPVWSALVTLVLFAAIYAISTIHRAFKLVIVLAIITFVLNWLSHGLPAVEQAALASRSIFFFTITGLIFSDVLTGKTCGYIERLYGAAAVYLMVAAACAELYTLIDWFEPGAFTVTLTRETAQYFSLVTQTTLGYGDVSPVLPIARSVAVMQSTLGVLYIAILVARLAGTQPKDD